MGREHDRDVRSLGSSVQLDVRRCRRDAGRVSVAGQQERVADSLERSAHLSLRAVRLHIAAWIRDELRRGELGAVFGERVRNYARPVSLRLVHRACGVHQQQLHQREVEDRNDQRRGEDEAALTSAAAAERADRSQVCLSDPSPERERNRDVRRSESR